MRDQRTLSPLASALTRFAPATPLDSALTKNIPGGGGAPCAPLLSTLTLDSHLFSVNSFRLTHFRFIHFQKKVGGTPGSRSARLPAPTTVTGHESRVTNHGFDLALATWRRFPYTLGFLATGRRF